MAIILTCDGCQKRMGTLERHTVKDGKYLCAKCAEAKTEAEKELEEIAEMYSGGILCGLMR